MRARRPAILLGVLLALAVVAPASAQGGGVWHRLNPALGAPGDEHERLTCVERGPTLSCVYDKVVEDDPRYTWNATTGVFHGRDITAAWACPEFFGDLCADVVAVYRGPATYFPEDGRPFTVVEEYVVLESGGERVLYQYWVGQFACPWFDTWAEALAANPGSDPDCLFPD